MNMTVD